MDSPFPGMDPYLEIHWRSVHHRLITYAGDHLQAALPSRFRVEVEERVFVAGDVEAARTVLPDVYVLDREKSRGGPEPAAGEPKIASPVVLEIRDDPFTETYLEIIDTASGNKVITAIELISPTNKLPGDGSELYLRKQQEYRAAGVSSVEIDLTRQGDRNRVMPLVQVSAEIRTLHLGWVRRNWEPRRVEFYPMPLEEPLPTIGVPLIQSLPDAPLPLQTLLEQCYRNGRYGDDLDYRAAPYPPLPPDDDAWADQRLRTLGVRA